MALCSREGLSKLLYRLDLGLFLNYHHWSVRKKEILLEIVSESECLTPTLSAADTLHSVWDILRCQEVKLDMGLPPVGYMTAVTQIGSAEEFLALLPLEAEEWKEWSPFKNFHSSGAPTLIEIDMKKGYKLFSHTLALLFSLLRAVMQTVCSETRQNLMRLFFISGKHCVLIGVCAQLVFCCILLLCG